MTIKLGKSIVENNRDILLAAIAIFGMAILGVIAMMAQWVKEGWISRWWLPHDPFLTLLLCGFIGAAVGVLSVPCVVPCLRRASLSLSLLLVYGVNGIVVSLYVLINPTGLTGPLSSALVALVGVCMIARLIKSMQGR